MAKQRGIIKLTGSMDGLTFYKAYGKNLVRKTRGPSKKQIMSGANFQRTREHISEFGACSKISTSFRSSLGELKPLTDGQFGNRLTKLFTFVTRHDEGVRGQRPIKLSSHRKEFRDFECNIKYKLAKAIPGSFTISHNTERTAASVTIHGAQSRAIEGPEGATHFQLVHALSLVSDFVYQRKSKGYGPAEPYLNTMRNIQYSDYFSLEDEVLPEYTSTVSLGVTSPLPDSISVVHAIGISFFQKVASVYHPFKQGNALKVVEIF